MTQMTARYCLDIYYTDGFRLTVYTHNHLTRQEAEAQRELAVAAGHSTALYPMPVHGEHDALQND
jgi:hypothetical protein